MSKSAQRVEGMMSRQFHSWPSNQAVGMTDGDRLGVGTCLDPLIERLAEMTRRVAPAHAGREASTGSALGRREAGARLQTAPAPMFLKEGLR